jgi:hypothetical protein
MSGADFAARSRAAFAERFPNIITALSEEEQQSSLILEGGRPVDIVIGNQRIYGGDARRHAVEQVEAYVKKPLRLVMEAPDAAGLVSEVCIDLKLALERSLDEAGMTEISRGPLAAPTFLVVFGVGLGYHLEELIRTTGARWLIIVEPFVEFIAHSFHAVDWRGLLDRVDERGGAVHFITDLDPGRIVGAIMHEVARRGTPYLDGTWVFTHYPVWTFAEAAKRLHGAAEFAYVNRGFFEDEIVMMTNAVTNFSNHAFWLLDGKPRRHRPETAVIVGAGPSLDEALETLHRIRDRVVLFSGGTALRPLLRNGLSPDFHCELENGPQVHEVISEAAEYGDLARIRFIGSATVDARVPALFGEAVLFFRDTVSSTRILHGDIAPLNGGAPTCVNTAMAAAAALGFTDFVLFGADCGTRPGMPDHAEGTIYRDVEKWQQYMARRARYPLEVDGNFGGIANTNWVYDASRRMLIDLIATYQLKVVNCSDGALINGATPRVPESLDIDGSVIDHERIVGDLKRSMRRYGPRELLRHRDLEGLRQKSRSMYRALQEIVAGFDPAAADFAGVFDAMAEFLRRAGDTYGFAHAIPDGSLSALPRVAMFYGSRTEGPMRRHLFEVFIREFTRALEAMEQQTDALLRRLVAVVGEPAPAA